MPFSSTEKQERALKLRTVFKPGTPINRVDLFSERLHQSRAVLAAINQNGRHAVLFGERGVGKTSLANMLFLLSKTEAWPKITPIVNCTRKDSYGSLWGRVFSEILDRIKQEGIALPKQIVRTLRLAQEGVTDGITMDTVKRVLSAVGEASLLVASLDEFDTLADRDVREAIADTIKYLSDRNCPCTILIIGVSDDVDTLIADHRSIERCLAQVRMPRMSRDELEQIATNCLKVVDMTIELSALHEISRISTGLPHYTHLLGLHASLQSIDASSSRVSEKHVRNAMDVASMEADQTIQDAYFRATESSQSTARYQQVLTACAMTEPNDLGYFSPSDVRIPLSRILKEEAKITSFTRNLHALADEDNAAVLKSITVRGRPQFRFINPLMQPFALMKGLKDKIITEDDLKATRDPDDPQKRLF